MTETITKPYRAASGEGLADVWWKSGRVTVKAGGAEAGHAFSQIEVDDPRGSGPPLHLHHNEDETFYVLGGEVTFLVGDERIDVAAGDFLFAPRDIPHAYVVRSERARMLVTTSPGGVEQVFVSLGVPVAGSEPPTDSSCRRWTSWCACSQATAARSSVPRSRSASSPSLELGRDSGQCSSGWPYHRAYASNG